MAPEIIKEKSCDISWKKADVWSLACTTLEMTTGKPPWSQFNNSVTTLYHIACTDNLPEYPSQASVELITFLNICLTRDPSFRPDITSLLLHPFVTNMGLLSGVRMVADLWRERRECLRTDLRPFPTPLKVLNWTTLPY